MKVLSHTTFVGAYIKSHYKICINENETKLVAFIHIQDISAHCSRVCPQHLTNSVLKRAEIFPQSKYFPYNFELFFTIKMEIFTKAIEDDLP